MPSDLDRRYGRAMAALTAPGGALPIARDDAGNAVVQGLPPTIDAMVRAFCARHGAAEAVVAENERISFAAIDAASERVAGALAGGWGIGKGDRVAIAMRNSPAWMVVFIAVMKAGGVATLVNGWWTGVELAHGLDLTSPVLIIADRARAARLETAGVGCRVVEIAPALPLAAALAPLIAGIAAAPLPMLDPDDDATILFTSGSTDVARGAVSTHRQTVAAIYTFLAVTATLLELFYEGKRENMLAPPAVLIAVPLFHVTGLIPVFLGSIALGRKMVLMRKWDAGEALRLIEREQISYFIGVPTMSLELMQHPDRARYDTRTLTDIAAGGAPRPPSHVQRLEEAFEGHPMMGYGLTETNAVGCVNFRGNYLAKPNSTGAAQAPFVTIAIFDAAGRALAPGEIGEIGIKAAANFRGYWRDDLATQRVFTSCGHVLTGDLGYLDADGYLFIVDRAKDIIIRGGENISCQEVEAALYAHPAIAEASVFGLPCERLGEVPVAAIHLRAGAAIDSEALSHFLAARLARFKVPTRILLSAEALPKLGAGKIDKKALRARHCRPDVDPGPCGEGVDT